MSIKILGGLAKGQALFVPAENITRPTSVMLRRKLFDAVQSLGDEHFYDICAGSGGMGLEAWSRGALSVTLVEIAKGALSILKKNVSTLNSRFEAEFKERNVQIAAQKCEQWFSKVKPRSRSILFFDPPYKEHALYESFKTFVEGLECEGEVWIESDTHTGVDLNFFASWGAPLKCYEHSNSWVARWELPVQKTL